MRKDFDNYLLQLAEAEDVEILQGVQPKEIDFHKSYIRLSSSKTLQYKVLLGCDGVNSFVARALFFRSFDPKKIGFGLEIEVPRNKIVHDFDRVEIDFAAADWGYGWLFPKQKTFTLGVGGIHKYNPNLRLSLEKYLNYHKINISEYKVKGQYIPFGDFKKIPGQGAVLLCGDAAGLVDPITGEGIAYALLSGHYGAISAREAILNKNPSSALPLYIPRYKQLASEIRKANMWRIMIFPKIIQRPFAFAFSDASTLQRGYLDILSGKAGYNSLYFIFMKQTFKASTKPVRIIFKNLQKNHLTDKIMHFFAALLFKIFGWRLYRPLHLTTVSQVFEMVPWTGWRKILIGSLIFVLPVAFGLALLIIYRFPQIDHSLSVTIFLFIAALWSIAGPILIWQYEVRTLDIFDRKCHNYFSNDATYRQIRNFIYQPVLELKPCKIIVVIWMGISIISFFQVQGSVYRFAFFGPTDFLWILLFIGIILYSYYSSLGFCFIYKTVFLCRKLSSFLQVADFHNQRKSFGLGFVGDFSRSTCIPFLSGWLIVPLVFFSYLEEDSQNNFFPLGAILLYSLVAFLVVYYPVIIVRNKIRECKSQVIIDLYSDLYEKSVEFEKIKKLSNFLIIIILKLN